MVESFLSGRPKKKKTNKDTRIQLNFPVTTKYYALCPLLKQQTLHKYLVTKSEVSGTKCQQNFILCTFFRYDTYST